MGLFACKATFLSLRMLVGVLGMPRSHFQQCHSGKSVFCDPPLQRLEGKAQC